ncbi:unnamed protein product, partial [Iphiclides podalirius]
MAAKYKAVAISASAKGTEEAESQPSGDIEEHIDLQLQTIEKVANHSRNPKGNFIRGLKLAVRNVKAATVDSDGGQSLVRIPENYSRNQSQKRNKKKKAKKKKSSPSLVTDLPPIPAPYVHSEAETASRSLKEISRSFVCSGESYNSRSSSVTYGMLMAEAKSKIALLALGIESAIRQKRAVAGGLLLEVSGPNCGQKADNLAAKLREIFPAADALKQAMWFADTCGETGHKAKECTSTDLKCPLYSDLGLPSSHRLGNQCPKTTRKGKKKQTQATTAKTATATNMTATSNSSPMEVGEV